jgi:hypothetical protein
MALWPKGKNIIGPKEEKFRSRYSRQKFIFQNLTRLPNCKSDITKIWRHVTGYTLYFATLFNSLKQRMCGSSLLLNDITSTTDPIQCRNSRRQWCTSCRAYRNNCVYHLF